MSSSSDLKKADATIDGVEHQKDGKPVSKKRKAPSSTTASTSSSTTQSVAKKQRTQHAFNNELINLFLRTKVTDSSLWANKDNIVYVAQRTDKISEVFDGLVRFNFLSVPVLQKTKSKYYGFIDVFDIVSFILTQFEKEVGDANSSSTFWQDFLAKLRKIKAYNEATVNQIMRYPLIRKNPFHPVTSEYSLLHVVELLARERNLHRVPVLNNHSDRRLLNIISQSQVIRFIYNHRSAINKKQLSMRVSAIDSWNKPVISIDTSHTGQEAFEKMKQHVISGVAVVDKETGMLVDNISLRDVKVISTDGKLFHRLRLPIPFYLDELNALYKKKHGIDRVPLLSVTGNDTFETVLDRLYAHKVHHIFVVDENKKPVGICSLKDLLFELLENN